jgi:methionine biosynthesis protein MetW
MSWSDLAQVRRVRELWQPAPLGDFADYDEYWERRGPVTVIHPRWKIATEVIEDGSSVLDVGCGSGEFLRYLGRHRPGCVLRGVDLSPVAVGIARAEGLDAAVLDIEQDDLAAEADYVTCFEVIEHLAHAEVALDRLMGAARRKVIVSVPNVGFVGCRVRLGVFGRFPTTCCVFHLREHLRYWTVRDFEEWVEHCGYRLTARHPQHGLWLLRDLVPSLFASGMVYVIERPLG